MMNTGYTVLASIIGFLILFLFLSWLHVSAKYVGVKNNKNLTRWKNIIDAKNENLGWFDLGNHIIVIGAVLLAIFIVINAQ